MRTTAKASSGDVVDLTPIAARFIRIGLPEGDAKTILSDDGFVGGSEYASDEFDARPTPSEYYVAFRRSTPLLEFPWSSYVVALGFSNGRVDFVSAESKPEAWP